MKRTLVVIAFLLVAGIAVAEDMSHAQMPKMIALAASDLKWGDMPPAFLPGAKLAVVSGDPSKDGPFVIRVQMPAGYRVSPHWHPSDENVTVLDGAVSLGMGDKFDTAAMQSYGAGGFVSLPAMMHHFAWSKDGATIQIHGNGPFAIAYVNAADDPSAQRAAK